MPSERPSRPYNWRPKSLAKLKLYNNKEYPNAFSVLDSIPKEPHDANLEHQVALCKAKTAWANQLPKDSVLALYQIVPIKYYGILDFGRLALTHEVLGQKDSADFWLLQGYKKASSDEQLATLDYQRARIEERRGNFYKAYKLMHHSITFQDSLTRIRLTESVTSSQRDYFKKEMELETEKSRTNALKLRFLIVISILSIALVVLVFMNRLRASNAKLRESLATLHNSTESLEQLRKDNTMLVGSLLSEKLLFLDKLSYDYCHADTDKLKDAIFEQYKGTINSLKNNHQVFDEIESILNKYHDGILDRFRTQFPQIQGEKLDMVIIFFMRLPYNAAQLFFRHHNADSLKEAKKRIRKTIQESGAPDTALFLEMMEMKKGGRKTK